MLELVEGDLYNRLAGMTGLHLAAADGALETVRLLLDARADAAAKDNKGAVKSTNVAIGYGEDKLRQTWKSFLSKLHESFQWGCQGQNTAHSNCPKPETQQSKPSPTIQ